MADQSMKMAGPSGKEALSPSNPILSLGLRPFFLMAALFSPLAILVWVAIFAGALSPFAPYAPSYWHAHEMLFGYAAAAISGFFLTAVPSWTGAAPLSGPKLALLAGLWLAGRLAMWGAGLWGPWAAAIVDLAYLPALGAILVPSLAHGSRKNFVFLAILSFLFLGNLLFHLEALGLADTAARGLNFTVDLVALLITVIGGRVTPAFTQNALKARAEARAEAAPVIVSRMWLNEAAIFSVAVMALGDLAFPNTALVGVLALVAAVLGAIRLACWKGSRTLHEPLLWVLHLGYGWVVLGLAIKGIATLTGALPLTVALHGITIGAIGTMTLGVMSRASLGHTGRPLHAVPSLAVSYLLISAAALVRLVMPVVLPEQYLASVILSGVLWIAAFAIFAILFVPILLAPRADAKGN